MWGKKGDINSLAVPDVVCFAGKPHGRAGGCCRARLWGVVAQQDTATLSPRGAFLPRRAGSPAAPDARREVVIALWVFQQCCSFCSHIWGWSQHWKLSYTVAPASLKYACLKLQGNGLKKWKVPELLKSRRFDRVLAHKSDVCALSSTFVFACDPRFTLPWNCSFSSPVFGSDSPNRSCALES